MKLSKIISGISPASVAGSDDIEIENIVYDSRLVQKNTMFVCLKGVNANGNDYIEAAIKNGASCIVSSEKFREPEVRAKGAVFIGIDNERAALAQMSCNFFENPSKELTTIGITGTKGKTTTSCMIKSILEQSGLKTGLIGTLGVVIGDENIKLDNTTPESYEIQKYLRYMVNKGCKCVVLEASSIGLRDNRLDGITFDYGVFTNLSQDHIGGSEHKDMEEYISCKSLLFRMCKVGVVNADDKNLTKILENHTCKVKTFGFSETSDVFAKSCVLSRAQNHIGCRLETAGETELNVDIPIPGKFNAYNALAAICTCTAMKISSEHIKQGLETVQVKGRVEIVKVPYNFTVIIDYAHNPVSMENILLTLKEYKPKRLITLFGAGGNRPKVRRYEVGEIVGRLCDLAIVTEDNSRYEDVMDIMQDIKKGLDKSARKYEVIPDRQKAIEFAINNAQEGDIILLAGKGHETYKELRGVKYPFDEREIVQNAIKNIHTQKELV